MVPSEARELQQQKGSLWDTSSSREIKASVAEVLASEAPEPPVGLVEVPGGGGPG